MSEAEKRLAGGLTHLATFGIECEVGNRKIASTPGS